MCETFLDFDRIFQAVLERMEEKACEIEIRFHWLQTVFRKFFKLLNELSMFTGRIDIYTFRPKSELMELK